jgi:phage terminase large subunit-like protein
MADLFLSEVKRMHQLRQDINEMTPEETDELIRGLGDYAAEDWVFAARNAQLPPPDLSWCWLFLGGRGAGKSHSMSAAVHTAVRAGIKRIHFIAPTTTDFHDVNVEGKSGNSRPAGVIHGRAGCRRGGGWNGQTAQCACSSRARSRNRCAGRKRKW